MTREENELLTRSGPGTPCGELHRRYWQPAALSEELPPEGVPLPVQVMGEELVLFRDDQGHPGLLALHCSHRGADLSYGRVESGGLRCLYHGWLYDIHGRCLEQPGEPGGGKDRSSIRHPAYPCVERAGAIFAYLGPGEPPLFPNYDFLTAAEGHVFATKLFHDCNYWQGNEGNIDLVHVSFLHFNRFKDTAGPGGAPVIFSSRGAAAGLETTEVELTEFGLRVCKIRRLASGEKHIRHIRVGSFVFPNLAIVPGQFDGREGYTVNWHAPIDDTHHWKYSFIFNRDRPLNKDEERRGRTEMTPDYEPLRNKVNRYLQDRESMKAETYSGIGLVFQAQDCCVVEGAGAIQNRTEEHLVGSSDAAVVAARKLLLKAIREVQQGRDPPHVIRDAAANCFPGFFAYSDVIDSRVDWKEHLKQRVLVTRGEHYDPRRE